MSDNDVFGQGPKPKSAEYLIAVNTATRITDKLSPKIFNHRRLTTAEATQLLNVNWNMYLHALGDGDFAWARETAEFVDLVEQCLRLDGYIVELSAFGKYCVYRPRRTKRG